MKILIVYDSVFGNTEQIARAIGNALEDQEQVAVLKAGDVLPANLVGLNYLIVGSPTQRFSSTPAVISLLKTFPENSLRGIKVTAFDTRLTVQEINKIPILAFFVKLFGRAAYAAGPLADRLKRKGGEICISPEGFFVEGMQGPLAPGELERAKEWARQIETIKF